MYLNSATKFAYRSEIIVDEISNNAVNYGCKDENAFVDLECTVDEDKIEFTIKDQGGTQDDLEKTSRLQSKTNWKKMKLEKKGLGIGIVKMLSESMDINIDEQNLTSIHVVRKREEPN